MQQSQITHQKVISYEKNHQSFHLKRLIQCIDNKKSSSSHKLKEMQKKTERLHSDRQIRMQNIENELKSIGNLYNQSIVVNTKEILVGKNKTQLESPREQNDINKKNGSIFINKSILQNLYGAQKCVSLSSRLKEKLNNNPRRQKSKKKPKDGFPHLAMPKIKRPVQFQRYDDKPNRYLNGQFVNLHSNKSLEAKSFQRSNSKESNKDKNLIVQNIQKQRKHFNESLKRLIQKAFKGQISKISTNQNSRNFIETIQECDNKLIKTEQQQKPKQTESLYAEKDRLLLNPDLKIKKGIKSRTTRKTCVQSPATMGNPESAASLYKQTPQSSIEIKSKKRIIHTNRDSYYIREALKLKTQILSSSKTDKERQYFDELLKKFQDYSAGKCAKMEITKSTNMRKKGIQKTKTMQPELANIKTPTKWEFSGYDLPQTPQNHRQSNGILNYMENLAQKSAKKTFYKKPLELKTKFDFNDFELPNVTSHKRTTRN